MPQAIHCVSTMPERQFIPYGVLYHRQPKNVAFGTTNTNSGTTNTKCSIFRSVFSQKVANRYMNFPRNLTLSIISGRSSRFLLPSADGKNLSGKKRQFICGPKQKSRISSPAHYINFVCYFAVILLLVSDISAVQTQKQPRYNSAPSS